MTLEERVIVSAYTGWLMCDFSHVHAYIEKKLGRPVWTHEMAASNKAFHDELHEAVKPDFLRLCGNTAGPVCDGLEQWWPEQKGAEA